jgi:hypothetical protein
MYRQVLVFSYGERPQESRIQMTTQKLVANMIDKYVEVYARAIAAGYSEQEAHKVTAEFFATGFKAVA